MTKKVVISGYYGYDNFGDESILAVLTEHLHQLKADITVFSHNPYDTARYYGINAVSNFNPLKIIFALRNCDVLISGGGSLLQDVTSLKSLFYYSFIIWLAQVFNKEIIIFSQGIGPLQRKISKNIVKNLLSKCNLVTVRDQKSYEMLQNWGINAQIISDPLFFPDFPVSNKEEIVGIQLRAFKTLNDEFLYKLADVVIKEFAQKKIELYVFQYNFDMEISQKFEKILKSLYPGIQTEIIHSISKNDIIVKISQLEYMIAMRFHAVLVAIKTGVPTIAINYDAKVAKLAYEAFIPILTLSADEDFDSAFIKLKELKPVDLLNYAKTKTFSWSVFDDILK